MAWMKVARRAGVGGVGVMVAMVCGCSRTASKDAGKQVEEKPAAAVFQVDPSTATVVKGVIRMEGKAPPSKPIDMSEDPTCVAAHHGKAYDESLVVGKGGGVADAFVYVKGGLEGKSFAVPPTPVVLDQRGCWFRPRVLGIQVGQELKVVNSDPVTHNIHPMAEVNREWNHSQGPGDAPLARKFMKPEVMIKVKCNIHNWMHAYIGVVDSPYFAVSGTDGTFEIRNLPPGNYVVGVWHETLGTQEQQVTTRAGSSAVADFKLKGR